MSHNTIWQNFVSILSTRGDGPHDAKLTYEHQWSCSPSWCKAHTQLTNYAKILGQSHFAEPNRHVLTFFSSNYNFSRSRTEHRWSCSYWCKSSQSSQSFNPKLQNWDKRTKQRTYIHVNEAFCTMMRTQGLHNFQVPPLSPVHWAIALTYDPEPNQNMAHKWLFSCVEPCCIEMELDVRRVSLNPFLYLFLKISRNESFHRFITVLPIWGGFFQSQFLSIKCSDL